MRESDNLPFDPRILLERCMNEIAVALEVLDRLEASLGKDIAHLCDVLDHGDAGEGAALAHKIRGSSAQISAIRLTEVASQLELRLRDSADVGDLVEHLLREARKVIDVIPAVRRALPQLAHRS